MDVQGLTHGGRVGAIPRGKAWMHNSYSLNCAKDSDCEICHSFLRISGGGVLYEWQRKKKVQVILEERGRGREGGERETERDFPDYQLSS